MGWTHDHSDTAARDDRRALRPRGAGPRTSGSPGEAMGIPRILRRRARWVSARLRHPRN
ncbi:hypothetical protein ACSMX9_11885 [Streptomyces sp. LE64]|uniref:hypothetical protein n=1 Tax=unclassified Streptomyces TaxID=2593676 RepID=UPI003330F361